MFNPLKHFRGLWRRSARHLVTKGSPDVDRSSLAGSVTISGAADAASIVVAFDEKEIYCTFRTRMGEANTVKWSDLREVVILTTGDGPFSDDLFWLLIGDTATCIVPGRAVGCNRLLSRLQQLPGFNNIEVIGAMGSTGQARFVCWRRAR